MRNVYDAILGEPGSHIRKGKVITGYKMASDAVKKNTEVLLSSVLISAKDGVPLHHLAKEFREVTLSDIPLQKLGYPSLELYIKSIPHCAQISTNLQGVLVVKGVANESNKHVLKLVVGQKKGKKRSAISKRPRGRGGFSRRSRPLTVIRKSNPFEFSNSSIPTRFGQSSRGFHVARANNSNLRPGIFGRPPINQISTNSFAKLAESFQSTRGFTSGSNTQRQQNVGLPRTNGFASRSSYSQSQIQNKVLQEAQNITSGAVQHQSFRSTTNVVSSTYVLPPRMRRLQEQHSFNNENLSSTQSMDSTPQSFGRKVEKTDLRQVLNNRKQSSSSDINQNDNAATLLSNVSKKEEMKFTIRNDQRSDCSTGTTDDFTIKENVIKILEGKPNGLWSGVLLQFYKNKFGEPPNNLLNLMETTMTDRFEIKSMTAEKSIIYLKKEPEIVSTIINENTTPARNQNSAPIHNGNTAPLANGREATTRRKVTVMESNDSIVSYERNVVVMEEEEEFQIPNQVIPEAGETFAAYICHVDTIDRFFVNRADSEIMQLSEKIQTFYENCDQNQHLLKPKIGMMCCALFQCQWFRARIIMSKRIEERAIYQAPSSRGSAKLEQNPRYKCKVLYVDFGNMETISSKDMRKLHQKFCEIPAQAIQCKLRGITREGSQAEWSEEAVTCFQEITLDNLLDVKVVAARDNILDVDLMTTDDQSIAEELISRGLAISEERRRAVSLPVVQNPEEPEQNPELEREEQAEPEEILSPKSSILDRLTSLSLDIEEEIEVVNVELPTGDFIDILVTAVNSLTEISAILLGKEYKGRLVVLGASMQAYFDSEETDDLETVELDAVYAAFYEDDWNRVRVTDIREDEVEIYLVDRGDNGTVQRSELKKLPAPFRRLPLQAIELTLASLPDSENLEHVQILSDMILGKELVAMLLERNPDETIVELFDTSAEEDLNINEQIIVKLGLNEDQDYSQTLPQAGEQTDAIVSHISDTGVFNVILPGAGFQKLDELIDELSNYYSKAAKAADLVKDPEHEKIVCTKWKEDGQIYRAKITCVMTEEKKAEIEFIDYGNRDVVSFVTLREIPEKLKELLTLPPQNVKCKLADCTEDAKQMWKYGLAKGLSAELGTQAVVIKVVQDATEDQMASVEILKADAIDTSKFTSISEDIAEMCLSMRDSESSAVSTDSSLWNNEGESISSHLDKPLPPTRSSSSSSDPFSEKPSSSEAAVPSLVSQTSVASVASDSFAVKTGLAVRDATILDLIVKEKWCPVYVTFAQSPAKFYFLFHENIEMLAKLMEEMDQFYKDNDDNCEDQPDDICAVFVEETWYRGVVRSRVAIEDEDRVTLGVFLVDDGETVFVSEEEVRHLPKQFHSLPFQAVKASLSDVLPVASDKWPRKACKRYSEFVSHKLLYARIKAPSMSYPASYSLIAGDSLDVQLYDTTAAHIDVLICDQLIYEGHARAR